MTTRDPESEFESYHYLPVPISYGMRVELGEALLFFAEVAESTPIPLLLKEDAEHYREFFQGRQKLFLPPRLQRWVWDVTAMEQKIIALEARLAAYEQRDKALHAGLTEALTPVLRVLGSELSMPVKPTLTEKMRVGRAGLRVPVRGRGLDR